MPYGLDTTEQLEDVELSPDEQGKTQETVLKTPKQKTPKPVTALSTLGKYTGLTCLSQKSDSDSTYEKSKEGKEQTEESFSTDCEEVSSDYEEAS